MVKWAREGLHMSVTPRSSQGHNNVKSAKKGKNRLFLLQLCSFRMSMMAETHLCPNTEVHQTQLNLSIQLI